MSRHVASKGPPERKRHSQVNRLLNKTKFTYRPASGGCFEKEKKKNKKKNKKE